MKQLVQVTEVEGEGLLAFMGLKIEIWCDSYIYTGKVVGVNDTFVKLEDASVVFETGELAGKAYKDVQKDGGVRYVQVAKIESFKAGK